ncbi:unnamed protein product [Diamesa serratosioi]
MGVVVVYLSIVALIAAILCFIRCVPKMKLDIPSPKSWPIIGHVPYMIGLNNEEQLKVITELSHLYPKLVKIWFFHIMAVMVSGPELIQKVFNSDTCMEKPHIAYGLFNLDYGLLSSTYSRWKHDRKFFNNSFKINIIQSFIPVFTEAADSLVSDIAKYVDGDSFNVMDYTIRCTLKMICSTSLGMDLSDPDNAPDFDKVFHAVEFTSESVALLQNKAFVYPQTFYKLTPRYWETKKYEKCLKDFHQKIIDERRAMLQKQKDNSINDANNNEQTEDNEFEKPANSIFIDHILNNEGSFNDDQIKDHVITVLSAGYETSATATAHCLLFLAMHPNVQNQMYEEITEVFTSDDTKINNDTLSQLKYMDRVIKESMRIAPVGPVIFREALEDFEITPGCVVPKGTTFILNIYGLHRSKELWGPNACNFDPDNFLSENVSQRHPCSYIPFSTGRRNCIGTRYAMTSMKIMFLQLLRNYKFSTDLKYEDLRFKAVLTLKLVGEHLVKIERR